MSRRGFNLTLITIPSREIAHRNVCRMYYIKEEEAIHYITMEYVRGEDLMSLIRRIGQLPLGKSISISKQICEGLAEAHRLGVVHRDLKSNNIMILSSDSATLLEGPILYFILLPSILWFKYRVFLLFQMVGILIIELKYFNYF